MNDWETRKEESKLRANFRFNWSGEKLMMFRRMLGCSQNEFSNLLGIHQSVLSNYEKGRTITDLELMKKIESVCSEWKENRIKSLEAEINFIRCF